MLRVEIIKLNSTAVNAVAAYRPPNCKKGFSKSLENLVRIFDGNQKNYHFREAQLQLFKVARLDFFRGIPPKFEP